MKVGIMGGTFDPIHMGHLIAAQRALEGLQLDRIWFLPASVPPHKQLSGGASASQRLAMVRLATQEEENFEVCEAEMRRDGISYSYDTIVELQEDFPGYRFYYIIGADMVQYLPKWHRISELAQRIGFIGLQRKGYVLEKETLPDFLRSKVELVPMPVIEVSSTDIRIRRAEGKPVRYTVPDAVARYIEENGLYAGE
ncbi:nicotinate-nucleotide adenylyltransferase [Paenibacillus gansuensis]|uniref:Probable nicotinate-nucleotide adenylyltransferase n=1 Tax=Paenibacillus gansuensis TaxID=306542 RepID=A0ABW5PCQ7_9BACL